jgi:hypothetical protein
LRSFEIPSHAPWVRVASPALAGLAAALCVWSALSLPVHLEPGTPAWRRLVRGADGEGRLGPRASVLLPRLSRRAPVPLVLDVDSPGGRPVTLAIGVDGAGARPVRCVPGTPTVFALPAAGTSGARLDVSPSDGSSVVIRALTAPRAAAAPLGGLVLAAILVGAFTAALWRRLGATALGLGLWLGALLAVAFAPPLLWLSLPGGPALARLAPAAGAALLAWAIGRNAFARGAALLLALVFGVWVRGAFLPSAGSWDTEYWKTWMLRVDSHGLARVYGEAEPFDAGRLLRQARGQEALWKAPRAGRDYVVDYPPLAMAAWRISLAIVRGVAPGLDGAEAENVAVKLPPVFGDLGAVIVLLWTWRDRTRRALTLAALYWALPVSWMSSAVLGFLDAALAPLVAAALVAAGRGRALPAGLFLALAALIKPTALLVAPAAVMALLARRASLKVAVGAGLAVAFLVLLPFAASGTLATALVQMWRIAFQERLSGGFPNPWWFVSYAVGLSRGAGAFEPVPWIRVDSFSPLARPLGALLFAAVAALVAWRQRGRPGPGPALLAGAVLFFAYGMLAVGVHENHPHPLYLLLFATGLAARRLRLLTAATSIVYVLNMLAMSGLGRFYGPRYAALEPLIRAAAGFRMSVGVDVTLLLAVVNLGAFASMLWGLDEDLRDVVERGPA